MFIFLKGILFYLSLLKKNLDKSEYDFNKLKKTIQSLKEGRESEYEGAEFNDEIKEEMESERQEEYSHPSYDRLITGFGISSL